MPRDRRSGRGASPIDGATVRADFNALDCVVHYTRAAHRLGLWQSERQLIEQWFPSRDGPLLEAGCGAGRATIALSELGYRRIVAFDFAEELVDQARALANERGIAEDRIRFVQADATRADLAARLAGGAPTRNAAKARSANSRNLTDGMAEKSRRHAVTPFSERFGGALFLFNGLMQIPRRRARRRALRQLARLCIPGAPLIFTTHDRAQPGELKKWEDEAVRWANGTQDPRLHEFGDRYFAHDHGHTFMHLPVREEILADLAATGWTHAFDAMRREIAEESRAVKDFSDECRFWIARCG